MYSVSKDKCVVYDVDTEIWSAISTDCISSAAARVCGSTAMYYVEQLRGQRGATGRNVHY